ncbi:MAG: hypothetical protein ACJA08_002118 [Cyclobacteriaceae bacterium]|jgi:hypothetical protein
MEFLEYLKSKKIDSEKFKKGDLETFEVFQLEFDQLHPASFTAQKLYLINKIRRRYILIDDTVEVVVKKSTPAKPKILSRPKPKTN